MVSGTFLGPVALLYYLCFLLLTGLTLFIAFKGRRSTRARFRGTFFLLTLALENADLRPSARCTWHRLRASWVVSPG
jgi:hypothetical protein